MTQSHEKFSLRLHSTPPLSQSSLPETSKYFTASHFTGSPKADRSSAFSLSDSGINGNGKDGNCPNFTPTYPGGCSFILSVGATQNFSPEVAVNKEVAGFYSGAGASNFAPVPFYQKNEVSKYLGGLDQINNGHFKSGGRMFPDISAREFEVVDVEGDPLPIF